MFYRDPIHTNQWDFRLDLSGLFNSIQIYFENIESAFLIKPKRREIVVCCCQNNAFNTNIFCVLNSMAKQGSSTSMLFTKAVK